MKKLLVPLLGALVLTVGLTAPAHAAKVGTCENRQKVNLRLCASVNWADGNVWATGHGKELINTAFGTYSATVALYRQPCNGRSWTAIGHSRTVTGHDRLAPVTPTFRLQKGYKYTAVIVGSNGRTAASAGGGAVRYVCG